MTLRVQPQTNGQAGIQLVVDSTGLKIHDAGEWLEEKHKTKRKRRSWRKLHLGLDLVSGEIVCSDLTTDGVGDSAALPSLLDQVDDPADLFLADGAYDGERLDEVKLAEQFGVSRTPLREAFQSLAASGLLTLEARRGAFIRHPDFVELVEMFEVMAELEAMCGFRAARRVSEQQMVDIGRTIEACEAAIATGDFDEYYRENETFHHLLYEASGNRFLAREAARLHKRLKPYRRMQLRVSGRMPQSMREHRAIHAALEQSDGKAAATTLRQHVAIQGERFNDLMASYRQMASLKTG